VCQLLLSCRAQVDARDNENEYNEGCVLPHAPLFSLENAPMNPVILFVLCSLNTPLHWCCYGGHLDVCKLLVANKADVHARAVYRPPCPLRLALSSHPTHSLPCRDDDTPLRRAIKGAQGDESAVSAYLRSIGARY
jgi:hypothetical protein